MFWKKSWDYLVAHNVWSKVLAWVIYTCIGGICLFIYTHFNGKSFFGTIVEILAFKIPIWLFFLCIAAIIVFVLKRTHRKITLKNQKSSFNIQPRELSSSNPVSITNHIQNAIIFDSEISDASAWKGYNQRLWDNNLKEFIGEDAKGDYHFREHILTIARSNIAGRYILEIRKYNTTNVDFVPKNLYGRNPRNFGVKFDARVLNGGSYSVTVVFRPPNLSNWLADLKFNVSAVEWEPQMGSVAISCDQDFVNNIETVTNTSGTRLMIRNFKIEEL